MVAIPDVYVLYDNIVMYGSGFFNDLQINKNIDWCNAIRHRTVKLGTFK